MRRHLLAAYLLLPGLVAAQTAETLLLPDLLDLRLAAARAPWHPVHDATFAVRVDPYSPVPFQLRQYDPLGNVTATPTLPLPAFAGFIDNHQLYAVGADLAYVGPPRELFGIPVRHCFVIDALTGSVLFSSFLIG